MILFISVPFVAKRAISFCFSYLCSYFVFSCLKVGMLSLNFCNGSWSCCAIVTVISIVRNGIKPRLHCVSVMDSLSVLWTVCQCYGLNVSSNF